MSHDCVRARMDMCSSVNNIVLCSAISLGTQMLELDVQLTADKEVSKSKFHINIHKLLLE